MVTIETIIILAIIFTGFFAVALSYFSLSTILITIFGITVSILLSYLAYKLYSINRGNIEDQTQQTEKHEVLPLLVKVWDKLDDGKLYVSREDIEHLEIRKKTREFVFGYQKEKKLSEEKSTLFMLGGHPYKATEKSKEELEGDNFEMTAKLLSISHQSSIEWLLTKEKIDLSVSLVLFKFQPALMKIHIILEDSEENEITLGLDARKKIEDLLSPLLDELYKMKVKEEKTAAELLKSFQNKVNESYSNDLEVELVLSGLKDVKMPTK
ncbi:MULTISPECIES: hypothetical protein [unclassified Psychrobacillus]|uniref:hypothetical protein n=1 Tax=unclassified Psychrobacillus TaxID=2636677 RepID=UPI0030F9148D